MTKQKIVFALLMGIVTTCLISFTLISVNVGYGPSFIFIWLRSWAIAYCVAIPALLFISPIIQKIVQFIFKVHQQ